MSNIINLLTSQEMIVVYIVTGIACFIYFVIFMIDRSYYKRKRRQNTKELNQLVEDINIELAKENDMTNTDSLLNIENTYNEPVLEHISNNDFVYVEPINRVVEKKEEVKAVPVVENKAINVDKMIEEITVTPASAVMEEVILNDNKKEDLTAESLDEPEIVEVIEETTPVEPVTIEPIEVPVIETEQAKVEAEEHKEEIENTISVEENPTVTTITAEEEVLEVQPEVIEPVKETEELTYTSIEPTKQEAQAELRRLTEELEAASSSQEENITLTSFEEEQERDAIISLEELIKRSKEMYESNEISQYDDENIPISLSDLERQIQETLQGTEFLDTPTEPVLIETPTIEPIKEEQEQLVLEDLNTVEINEKPISNAYKTEVFKISPVISPIYGIEKTRNSNDMELENTANYEKLDAEIKKTNEFLAMIKDLQKNLK
ncbi:MAG: hypothetical protein MR031_04670 [Tenericutes bacterium]|nr:hypothetical protein [Mycoplasmatota bacterium]